MKYIVLTLLVIITLSIIPVNISLSERDDIYVVDALGRTVSIHGKPARIVTLAPSITEEIFYLGLEDRVVGMDNISYTDNYFNISKYAREHGIAAVGGYWWSAISVEKILSLKPDLVLADKGAHKPLLQTFEDYNITVVYLNGGSSRSVEDIYNDLDILATIFNKTGRVKDFINKLEENIQTYRGKLAPLHGWRVLVIVGIYNGIWIAGKSTYIDDILSRLGFINPADTIGWKAVSIEEIAEWDPDIILVASMGISNETLREAGIYDLGKPVVVLDQKTTDALSRPGPLILELPKLLYDTMKPFIANNNTETSSRTTTATTTLEESETITTKTSTTQKSRVEGEEYGGILYLTIVIAVLIVGIGIGYILSRIMGKRK